MPLIVWIINIVIKRDPFPETDIVMYINVTRRKTSAERMREHRRRRRNAVESELVQEPQHQVPYVEGSENATLSSYSDFYRHRLAREEFKINPTSL
ncbi:uncharacterized protein TNIN_193591 [Trichonephila inaurata madagascariensis]|uniref:Uncharacterized protein n=1 Tax=Trichonephila inaurata madagascariensis TaxID=2747483 RepID=A0A8X7CIK7_9ARAC|nr:uncharacterized protein TNIN_193591 [Trichonephila inaurata madagascariensis]